MIHDNELDMIRNVHGKLEAIAAKKPAKEQD